MIETGDAASAAPLIDEGISVAERLEMKPFIERLTALRTAAEAAPVSNPGSLSDREVEVLQLVAAGKSNQEIGDELFISLYTVNRHVSNIFTKIDASNRVEATVFAKDNGLAQQA